MAANKTKTEKPQHSFIFKKYVNIGAYDAIDDRTFLAESFIDNGAISILTDNSKPQCIILGRTGSGKTALLERISETKENVNKQPRGKTTGY